MTGSSPAQPRSRRSPAATGRWLFALGVFLVAVGVVAMHSLGAGHRVTAGALSSAAGGHSTHPAPVAVGAVSSLSDPSHRSSPAVATSSMLMPMTAMTTSTTTTVATPTPTTAGPAAGCAGCDQVSGPAEAVGHGLMAACLAVLPVFLVLLRPRWRGWFASARRLGSRPRQAGHATSWSLAALDPRRPSLAELCVLRT